MRGGEVRPVLPTLIHKGSVWVSEATHPETVVAGSPIAAEEILPGYRDQQLASSNARRTIRTRCVERKELIVAKPGMKTAAEYVTIAGSPEKALE